uniref:Uncharacterized protein n=1 Tax=Tanacetum cinerariifolium TaxID=118510 RepID=A0A6L2MCN3_TANCI|nr:hypothetical protein [Tanacetum cinerariifolium]
MDELAICLLQFDRAGYGESDLNLKRSLKSEASNIEVPVDPLQLGFAIFCVTKRIEMMCFDEGKQELL